MKLRGYILAALVLVCLFARGATRKCRTADLAASEATMGYVQLIAHLVDKGSFTANGLVELAEAGEGTNPVRFTNLGEIERHAFATAFASRMADPDFDPAAASARVKALIAIVVGREAESARSREVTANIPALAVTGHGPTTKLPRFPVVANENGQPLLAFVSHPGQINIFDPRNGNHRTLGDPQSSIYGLAPYSKRDGRLFLAYSLEGSRLKIVESNPNGFSDRSDSEIPAALKNAPLVVGPEVFSSGPDADAFVAMTLLAPSKKNIVYWYRVEEGANASVQQVELPAEISYGTSITAGKVKHRTLLACGIPARWYSDALDKIVLIDPASGRVHWTIPAGLGVPTRPLFFETAGQARMAFRTRGGVTIVNPATRKPVATVATSATYPSRVSGNEEGIARSLYPVTHGNQHFALLAKAGELEVVDLDRGEIAAPLKTGVETVVKPHIARLGTKTYVIWATKEGEIVIADFESRRVLHRNKIGAPISDLVPYEENGRLRAVAFHEGGGPASQILLVGRSE